MIGRAYSYQVQHAVPPEPRWVSPPSQLSAPVRGTPGPFTPIDVLFEDLGGTNGQLGAVTVAERSIPGGSRQDHQNGIIVQQDGAEPVVVWKLLADAHDAAGGGATMGFPLDEWQCGRPGLGLRPVLRARQRLVLPALWPAIVVPQVIEDGWAEAGWEEGPLEYPTGNRVVRAGGLSQPFQDGGVYWSAATGSYGVSAENHDTYSVWGGPAGRLGYPTTGDNCGLRGGGCWQGFQGGTIHWSPITGAQITDGAIRDA